MKFLLLFSLAAMAYCAQYQQHPLYYPGPQFYGSQYGSNQYDSQYGNKYDSQYGNKYDSQYGNKYDSQYGNKYDNQYGNKYDSQYGNKYDNQYGNKYDNRYGSSHYSSNPYGNTYGSGGQDGTYGASSYHYSWLHDGDREYTHSGAVNYCNNLGSGWSPVAIETQAESSFIDGIVSAHRKKFIWTGGVRSGFGWRWLSGGVFRDLDWSSTGGNGYPQPDNREGNENCLAILNNFYKDGVKWHDIACHHTKPVICEKNAY